MTEGQMPRILVLVAVAGLALAANRYAPGVLQAVLALVVLYVLLTHVAPAVGLVNQAPAFLGRGFAPTRRKQ